MSTAAISKPVPHRWYTRPVLFVSDVHEALQFYMGRLGFEKAWHEGDGSGGVCQVHRGECEIILCQDETRKDRSRLYIELTREGFAELQAELAARAVPNEATWWGSGVIQVCDPDGNELLFPSCDTNSE